MSSRYADTLNHCSSFAISDQPAQFEHMSSVHVMYHILDSQHKNPFFRSPISANAQNILDIGTGNGAWARDVADLFPSGTSATLLR